LARRKLGHLRIRGVGSICRQHEPGRPLAPFFRKGGLLLELLENEIAGQREEDDAAEPETEGENVQCFGNEHHGGESYRRFSVPAKRRRILLTCRTTTRLAASRQKIVTMSCGRCHGCG